VFGWQFYIAYNASAFVPQGDPSTTSTYPDGAENTVLFGSMTTPGAVNWAGLVADHHAFAGFVVRPGYIAVFFTVLAPSLSVTLSTRTLLANVNFELLSRPSTPQYFNVSEVLFVDRMSSIIPTVVDGLGISETVTNDPPHASLTFTPRPAVGPFAYTFNATQSADTDDAIPNPTGYFWDFGDGTQDLGVAGPLVTHNYGVAGKFFVSLRVQDALGATGSARNSLGGLILNLQPSHAGRVLGDLPPVPSFSLLHPYGAKAGVPILFDGSKSVDPDGTIAAYSWDFGDATPLGSESTLTHTFGQAGNYTVTLTVTDDSGSTAFTSQVISVGPAPKVTLFFQANDADDYENGIGELDVHVNGHLVASVPASLFQLNGTGEYTPFVNTWADLGPFDISNFVVTGTNSIVFSDPLGSHVSWIGPVRLFSSGSLILVYQPPVGKVNATQSVTLNFSNPPLKLSAFNVAPVQVFNTEERTFTANYTGGIGPFTCIFEFGDRGRAVVNSTTNSCSTSHAYWVGNSTNWWKGGGSFLATVAVQGANNGDRIGQTYMWVYDLPQPGLAGQGLIWATNSTTPVEVFKANMTNPTNLDLLIRIDFRVKTPLGTIDTFTSPSFLIPAGQTKDITFSYVTTAGLGQYCFTGTPAYGLDTNHDGVLQDSETLGTRHTESGCFTVG
jgi:PKD repeat protein